MYCRIKVIFHYVSAWYASDQSPLSSIYLDVIGAGCGCLPLEAQAAHSPLMYD